MDNRRVRTPVEARELDERTDELIHARQKMSTAKLKVLHLLGECKKTTIAEWETEEMDTWRKDMNEAISELSDAMNGYRFLIKRDKSFDNEDR
jgi:hypothetical protein